MKVTWIVVADASRAKIFSTNKIKFLNDHDVLHLVTELSHPASRLKDLEIVSDKAGRYRAKNTNSDTFFEPTEPKQHEADIFALELAKHLAKAEEHHSFQELILVAPPAFYGLLNKHISPKVKDVVSSVFEKDYTKENEKTLAMHLKKQIG